MRKESLKDIKRKEALSKGRVADIVFNYSLNFPEE